MDFYIKYKKQCLIGLAVVLLMWGVYASPVTAYSVVIDGNEIGICKDLKLAEALIQKHVDEVNANASYEMRLENQVEIIETQVKRSEILKDHTLETLIEEKLSFITTGYQVFVDDEKLFTFESKETAESFLDKVKLQNVTGDIEVKSVAFVEELSIEAADVKPDAIVTMDEAWQQFAKGKEELLTYTIESGDTTWDLVREFKMDIDDLARLNPGLDLERLQIGQEIRLNRPEAFINVKTVVTETVEEAILSDITYEKTDSMYVGEKELKSEGSNGKKKVELEKHYVNGILENQEVVAEEVLEEPVNTVILTGTKWREVVALGEFNNPASGVLTSRFGRRWGRQHSGIDIGASKGTPIRAAADGIVAHVGSINGYGMTVKVDHGNGVQTLYGHASGYNVKLGQVVSKNDVIAYVGDTGHTTGYCLHFEVRVNGVPVDPLEYVNY